MTQVSYAQLQDLTGMSYRTVKKRMDQAGLTPASVGTGMGGCDMWDSVQALKAIFIPEYDGGINPMLEKAKLDYAKREYQELKNAELKGTLAPVELTSKILTDIAINTRSKILSIPPKLSAIIPDNIRVDIMLKTAELCNEILTDLAAYVPDCTTTGDK